MIIYVAGLASEKKLEFLNSSTVVCSKSGEELFGSGSEAAYKYSCFVNNNQDENLQLNLNVLGTNSFDFLGYVASNDAMSFEGYGSLKFNIKPQSRVLFNVFLFSLSKCQYNATNITNASCSPELDANSNQGKVMLVDAQKDFAAFVEDLHNTESILFLKSAYEKISGLPAGVVYSVANVQTFDVAADASAILTSLASGEIFRLLNGESLQKSSGAATYTVLYDSARNKILAKIGDMEVGAADVGISFAPAAAATAAGNEALLMKSIVENTQPVEAGKEVTAAEQKDTASKSAESWSNSLLMQWENLWKGILGQKTSSGTETQQSSLKVKVIFTPLESGRIQNFVLPDTDTLVDTKYGSPVIKEYATLKEALEFLANSWETDLKAKGLPIVEGYAWLLKDTKTGQVTVLDMNKYAVRQIARSTLFESELELFEKELLPLISSDDSFFGDFHNHANSAAELSSVDKESVLKNQLTLGWQIKIIYSNKDKIFKAFEFSASDIRIASGKFIQTKDITKIGSFGKEIPFSDVEKFVLTKPPEPSIETQNQLPFWQITKNIGNSIFGPENFAIKPMGSAAYAFDSSGEIPSDRISDIEFTIFVDDKIISSVQSVGDLTSKFADSLANELRNRGFIVDVMTRTSTQRLSLYLGNEYKLPVTFNIEKLSEIHRGGESSIAFSKTYFQTGFIASDEFSSKLANQFSKAGIDLNYVKRSLVDEYLDILRDAEWYANKAELTNTLGVIEGPHKFYKRLSQIAELMGDEQFRLELLQKYDEWNDYISNKINEGTSLSEIEQIIKPQLVKEFNELSSQFSEDSVRPKIEANIEVKEISGKQFFALKGTPDYTKINLELVAEIPAGTEPTKEVTTNGKALSDAAKLDVQIKAENLLLEGFAQKTELNKLRISSIEEYLLKEYRAGKTPEQALQDLLNDKQFLSGFDNFLETAENEARQADIESLAQKAKTDFIEMIEKSGVNPDTVEQIKSTQIKFQDKGISMPGINEIIISKENIVRLALSMGGDFKTNLEAATKLVIGHELGHKLQLSKNPIEKEQFAEGFGKALAESKGYDVSQLTAIRKIQEEAFNAFGREFFWGEKYSEFLSKLPSRVGEYETMLRQLYLADIETGKPYVSGYVNPLSASEIESMLGLTKGSLQSTISEGAQPTEVQATGTETTGASLADIIQQMIDQKTQAQGISSDNIFTQYTEYELEKLSEMIEILQEAMIVKSNLLYFSSSSETARNTNLLGLYRADLAQIDQTIADLGMSEPQRLKSDIVNTLSPENLERLLPGDVAQNIDREWSDLASQSAAAVEEENTKSNFYGYTTTKSKTPFLDSWKNVAQSLSAGDTIVFNFADRTITYTKMANGKFAKVTNLEAIGQAISETVSSDKAAAAINEDSIKSLERAQVVKSEINVNGRDGTVTVVGGNDQTNVPGDRIPNDFKNRYEGRAESTGLQSDLSGKLKDELGKWFEQAKEPSQVYKIDMKNQKVEKVTIDSGEATNGKTSSAEFDPQTGKPKEIELKNSAGTEELAKELGMKTDLLDSTDKMIKIDFKNGDISTEAMSKLDEVMAKTLNVDKNSKASFEFDENGEVKSATVEDSVSGVKKTVETNPETKGLKITSENPKTGERTVTEIDSSGVAKTIVEKTNTNIQTRISEDGVTIKGNFEGSNVEITKPLETFTKASLENTIKDAFNEGKTLDIFSKASKESNFAEIKVTKDGVEILKSNGDITKFTKEQALDLMGRGEFLGSDSFEASVFEHTAKTPTVTIGALDLAFDAVVLGNFANDVYNVATGQKPLGLSNPIEFQSTVEYGVSTAFAAMAAAHVVGITEALVAGSTPAFAAATAFGPEAIALVAATAFAIEAAPFAYANSQLNGNYYSGPMMIGKNVVTVKNQFVLGNPLVSPTGSDLLTQTLTKMSNDFSGESILLAGNSLYEKIYQQKFVEIATKMLKENKDPSKMVGSIDQLARDEASHDILNNDAKTVQIKPESTHDKTGTAGLTAVETTGDLFKQLASTTDKNKADQLAKEIADALTKNGVSATKQEVLDAAAGNLGKQIEANQNQIDIVKSQPRPDKYGTSDVREMMGLQDPRVTSLEQQQKELQAAKKANQDALGATASLGTGTEGGKIKFSFDAAKNTFTSLDEKITLSFDEKSGSYIDKSGTLSSNPEVKLLFEKEGTGSDAYLVNSGYQQTNPDGSYNDIISAGKVTSMGSSAESFKINSFGANGEQSGYAIVTESKSTTGKTSSIESLYDANGKYIGTKTVSEDGTLKVYDANGKVISNTKTDGSGQTSMQFGDKTYSVDLEKFGDNLQGTFTAAINGQQASVSVSLDNSGNIQSVSYTDPTNKVPIVVNLQQGTVTATYKGSNGQADATVTQFGDMTATAQNGHTTVQMSNGEIITQGSFTMAYDKTTGVANTGTQEITLGKNQFGQNIALVTNNDGSGGQINSAGVKVGIDSSVAGQLQDKTINDFGITSTKAGATMPKTINLGSGKTLTQVSGDQYVNSATGKTVTVIVDSSGYYDWATTSKTSGSGTSGTGTGGTNKGGTGGTGTGGTNKGGTGGTGTGGTNKGGTGGTGTGGTSGTQKKTGGVGTRGVIASEVYTVPQQIFNFLSDLINNFVRALTNQQNRGAVTGSVLTPNENETQTTAIPKIFVPNVTQNELLDIISSYPTVA